MKKIMHSLFLSCLKATELIEKAFFVELNFKEKLQLKMHKSMCRACRIYQKQSSFLNKTLTKNHQKELNINTEEFKTALKKKISEK